MPRYERPRSLTKFLRLESELRKVCRKEINYFPLPGLSHLVCVPNSKKPLDNGNNATDQV